MCPAVAEPTWIVGEHGPTLGWASVPARPSGHGVLLLPALGYEYSTSHRTWRTLAELLADRGCLVLRLDLPGTADSAEPADGVTGIDGWRAAVRSGVAWLGSAGATSISLSGIRWGATLALLEAQAVGADAVMALAPVVNGKRYVRELKLLGEADPSGNGDLSLGGSLLTAAVLDAVAAVQVTAPVGVRVRSFDKPGAVPVPGEVESTEAPWLLDVLDKPAEEATIDAALLAEAADWLAPEGTPGMHVAVAQQRPSARFVWGTHELEETVVTTGPLELLGVLTQHLQGPSRDLLVLLNSGSDPHSGPGRAWVDLARGLAVPGGWSTLRLDATGWGESPDGPSVPGRPYDRHMTDDLRTAVQSLADSGEWDRIVLSGLCAGAWVALQLAREADVPLTGVVALNAQLYWQYGDPVIALMADAIAWRADVAAAEYQGATSGRWEAEDLQGEWPTAGSWLNDLRDVGRPVTLLFSGDDPGWWYLRDRVPRRLAAAQDAGVVVVAQLPELDHGLQRTWLRSQAVEAFATALERTRR